MTARTHDLIALASLVTVASYAPPQQITVTTLIISVIGNNIGALIPDLDSASNRLWDLLPAGDFLAKIFKRVFWKHRTLSHSFVGALLIYFLLDWSVPKIFSPQTIDSSIVIASIMIGYLSHLLADSFTKEGLPLLFPVDFNFGIPPISSLRITTGSWAEKIIVFPATIAYLFWFIYAHQPQLILLFHSVTG